MPSDHHLLADVLLKFLSLDQLLCANEKHERAVGRSKHTVNFVDADIALFCRLFGGQRHFEVDGDGEDVVRGNVSFRGVYVDK